MFVSIKAQLLPYLVEPIKDTHAKNYFLPVGFGFCRND